MNLCSCRPADRRHSSEPLRCETCGDWISRGRALSRARVLTITAEVISILNRLTTDHEWLLTMCWEPTRTGESSRTSGPSDPTGAAVSNGQRGRIAAYMALSGKFLERAALYLRLADEALGDALYASDPRPPERAEGEWYPQIVAGAEIEASLEAQRKRFARGEGIP